ncbi:CAP-Gly domain-containing linker protein 1 isoform X3 [Drosophila subobscura]|uniref:CAP-Gly domain-containing linker protein 1 isoform X3 n=1 Tax=Drosophila subobscura TaxID=7241 RepID=UPI00155A8866|nr:CAP-Gly domain-containing linker protein 1 isoform X3 [Drosophila subobscura]
MNTPGMSLFQGAEPLNVSSTLERQEEEEALEDQKRRDEELGNLLENAFDDLDDDESTIDSTTNFQSDLLPEQPHHHHHHQQQQQQQHHPAQGYVQPTAEEDHHHRHASEMHKLKMMLESKSHEHRSAEQKTERTGKDDRSLQRPAVQPGGHSGATAELDLMDTLLQQNQTDEPSAGPRAASTRLVGSTPLNPVDRIGHIKQELYRALANLKHMREEVRKLEKQLEERNQELRLLRGQENQSLVQLATLKEDKVRLESRVKNLQQELEELDRRSKNDCKLQEEVNVLMAERDAVTEHRQKMDNQLKKVQIDLDRVNQDHEKLKQNYEQLLQDNRQLRSRDTADNMRLDLERHKILLKDAQSEVERLKKLYADIANDKETLSYELRKLRELDTVKELHEQRQQLANLQRTVQIAELKSEELASILEAEKHSHQRELQAMRDKCEHDKCEEVAAAAAKENSANCSKCVEKWSEITKAEIQMLKLQNINARQAKDLRQLAEELEQSKAFQAELEEKIERSSQQESLLSELKDKAKQMEEYIRQQEEATAKKTPSPRAPSIELSPERIKRIEQRVRDEMAKLFAVELKNFNARLHQSEEKNRCLQREHQLVCGELQQRQNEVDLLKQTILAEREKIEEILEAKEEKQKVMLQKCRSEIQAKNQRIAELMRALDEQHASIDSERKSMKAVMAQWDAQKQSVEQHWREQLQMLRETHEEALRTTQQRYQSAKRTAHNYKLYAEDKEAHMKREYDRIKHEYELSLAKIELQMNQRLERKSRDKENQPSNSNSNSNNR